MHGSENVWRQGCILSPDSARSLGLAEPEGSRSRAVVISHDCDLRNQDEQFVELIVGTEVDTLCTMYENARHPRILHLEYVGESGEELCIELRHVNHVHINRSDFLGASVDSVFTLSLDQKRGLKQWFAARYGRPAFPNAFEGHLRKRVRGRTVEQRIARILEPASSHLVALLFDLGADRACERTDGDAYSLRISIVYDAIEGGPASRVAAEQVASDVRELFEEAYRTPDLASEIALESCVAVADTHVSLADLRRVDQWRLEYISLRDDPASGFVAAGSISA